MIKAITATLALLVMKEFDASLLLSYKGYGNALEILSALKKDTVLTDETRQQLTNKNLDRLEDLCNDLGLRASLATIRKVRKLCEKPEANYEKATELFQKELGGRLADELRESLTFTVSPDVMHYYLDADLFGDVVADRFPSAVDDIESAGKCLALGQGTACVFHLMRVMELGLRAVAAEIGIPYAPSWEAYLKQITAKLAIPWKDRAPEWRTRSKFFSEVLGDLVAVKYAWRNPTIHVQRDYDEPKATAVFNTVRSFMEHIAKELREIPAASASDEAVSESPCSEPTQHAESIPSSDQVETSPAFQEPETS